MALAKIYLTKPYITQNSIPLPILRLTQYSQIFIQAIWVNEQIRLYQNTQKNPSQKSQKPEKRVQPQH